MSELQYGKIPELEKQLDLASQAEIQDMTLLKHSVTENEIAEILAHWTGIPVAKMLEGEREKLLNLEKELHQKAKDFLLNNELEAAWKTLLSFNN